MIRMYSVWFGLLSLGLLGCAGTCPDRAAPSDQRFVDTVSAASGDNAFEESSLSGDALVDTINRHVGASIFATVNPDGSPNAAFLFPFAVSPKVLMLPTADNRTKANILATGQAVMILYHYDETAPEALRHQGARLVLELIADETQRKSLFEEAMKKSPYRAKLELMLFLSVRKVLPVG